VPRDVSRADAIAQGLAEQGAPFCRRSLGQVPQADHAIWLADSYGELGLWYRLAETALIGGGFDDIGGHNPWEAAQLGCAILYGPDSYNFADDYARLNAGDAARQVDPGELADALQASDLADRAPRATGLSRDAAASVRQMAQDLIAMMGQGR
jgi:3-deoxy-D-manno-octulosonic-acid transferase